MLEATEDKNGNWGLKRRLPLQIKRKGMKNFLLYLIWITIVIPYWKITAFYEGKVILQKALFIYFIIYSLISFELALCLLLLQLFVLDLLSTGVVFITQPKATVIVIWSHDFQVRNCQLHFGYVKWHKTVCEQQI